VPLYAMRAKRKGYEVSAMKALMDEVGLVGGKVRPPLVDVKPDDMKVLRESLPKWREWM
jgi:dihydrodipicolinate synthase/N-acetylneuraminate lyase